MSNALSENPKRVLVFNPLKKLIAIVQSCNALALTLGIAPVNVHDACVGKNISCHNLYLRYLDESKIEIDMLEDLGTLRLEDYDKFMGFQRKYYPNKYMSRTGMEYNKSKKKKS